MDYLRSFPNGGGPEQPGCTSRSDIPGCKTCNFLKLHKYKIYSLIHILKIPEVVLMEELGNIILKQFWNLNYGHAKPILTESILYRDLHVKKKFFSV